MDYIHDGNIKKLVIGAGIMELLLFFCGFLCSRMAGTENSSIVFIAAYCLLSLYLILWIFLFIRRQGRQIDEAAQALKMFMEGEVDRRLCAEQEGKLSLLFSGINDLITSLQAHMEKEKKAKLFLQDMISDISHQMKTPLTAVKMYNEIISNEPGNVGVVVNFSEKTKLSLDRMEGLVKNLLKIAKLDAGTILFQKKMVKVKPMMERLKAEYETRAGRESKKIVLEGAEGIELYCDYEWMMEAVGNLVKNALDHTERNGEIKISWRQTALSVYLQVADNGCGIPEEDIYHIFKRFYRSRFSLDKEGIGLGLSLAKAVVEAHEGNILVESERGRGTVFSMNFPEKQQDGR